MNVAPYPNLKAAGLRELSQDASRLARALEAISHRAEENTAVSGTPSLQRLARLARQQLRERRYRDGLFPEGLFADPAWDLLLDLFAAKIEGKNVSVSSACIASAVPPTTALRWIGKLHDLGLIERVADEGDGRRVIVEIAPIAEKAIAKWLGGLLP